MSSISKSPQAYSNLTHPVESVIPAMTDRLATAEENAISVHDTAEAGAARFSKLTGVRDDMVVSREALRREHEVTKALLDPDLEASLRLRLAEIYGSVTSLELPVAPGAFGDDNVDDTEAEQEYDFRLFDGGPWKIILRKEDGMGEGAFVPMRDPRVFRVAQAVGDRKAAFEQAAVAGEEVLAGARRRAWGLEVPWRVTIVMIPGQSRAKDGDHQVGNKINDSNTKRKKAGKKRRILLRKRQRKAEEIMQRKKAENLGKEEAEREKKMRRNREKTLKRRMKAKASKTSDNASVDDTQIAVNMAAD